MYQEYEKVRLLRNTKHCNGKHVLNRIGTFNQLRKTTCKLWYGKKSEKRHLKIFVITFHPQHKRRKIDKKYQKGKFLGYSENIKVYRINFRDKRKTEMHKIIIFNEGDW